MEEKDYRVLDLIGKMDESYVSKAGEPWKTKKTQNFRWHGAARAACAALVIACGMIGIFHPRVNAAVQEFLSRIGQIAGREEEFAPYANQIGQSQTKDGVTLTLEEVALTDNQLYMAVTMETDPEHAKINLEHAEVGGDFKVYLDGSEEISIPSTGGFLPGSSRENGYVLEYTCEDGMIPVGHVDITLEVFVYEDPFDTLSSEKIPFEFSFSASGSELKENTLQVPLEQKIEVKPGVVLELEEFSLNPIFSRIRTKCGEHDGSLPIKDKQYYLIGEDSLGNEVRYSYQKETGSYGRFYTEETSDGIAMPSLESEWVELQLYTADFSEKKEWREEDMVQAGEKFRIALK